MAVILICNFNMFVGLATPNYRAPQVMWTSEETTIAIKGDHKYMKCIFAG